LRFSCVEFGRKNVLYFQLYHTRVKKSTEKLQKIEEFCVFFTAFFCSSHAIGIEVFFCDFGREYQALYSLKGRALI